MTLTSTSLRAKGLRFGGGFLLAVLFLGGAVAGCSQKDTGGGGIGLAPDFSLTDIQGRKVTLSDLKGKAVLLDFWATWCPPCRMELPHFKEMYKKFGGKNFEIIGMAVDESVKVKEFSARESIPFTVIVSDEKTARDYQVRAFPTTYLIDKDGAIVQRWIGYQSADVFEQAIRKVIPQ